MGAYVKIAHTVIMCLPAWLRNRLFKAFVDFWAGVCEAQYGHLRIHDEFQTYIAGVRKYGSDADLEALGAWCFRNADTISKALRRRP
jgi:hypothetical protein